MHDDRFPKTGTSQLIAVARLAHWLRATVWLIACASIVFSMARWMLIGTSAMWLPASVRLASIHPPQHIDPLWRLAGFALELIPLAALLYTLNALRHMCHAFLRGDLFTTTVVQGFRAVGRGVLWLAMAQVIYQFGVTGLISWLGMREQGAHGGIIGAGLSSFEFSLLLIGLTMFLLGHVMDRARELGEDSAQII